MADPGSIRKAETGRGKEDLWYILIKGLLWSTTVFSRRERRGK